MRSGILGLYVNELSADAKFSRHNTRSYRNQFKCIYRNNQKLFVNIFIHFLNLHKIVNILKKKLSLIAEVFLNLFTAKNVDT